MTDPAPTPGSTDSPDARLTAALRAALAHNELSLVLQPIFDLATRRIVCAEALVRWNLRGYTEIPPERFIALADETDLIHDIGEWGLASACAHARQWIARGHRDVNVSVNFTATQFCDAGFTRRTRAVLAASGLTAERLEIEIAATGALRDPAATANALAELRKAGARVALDDVGLSGEHDASIKRLPLQFLKVDISVVHGLPWDPAVAARVRALVGLCKAQDWSLVAEGVETGAQLEFLRDAGCARAQGNFLSPPVAPDAFPALLAQHNAAAAPAVAPPRRGGDTAAT